MPSAGDWARGSSGLAKDLCGILIGAMLRTCGGAVDELAAFEAGSGADKEDQV